MLGVILSILDYVWVPVLLMAIPVMYLKGRQHGRARGIEHATTPEIPSAPSSWTALSSPCDDETINVYVRRGAHKLSVGSVKIADEQFEKILLDLMATAQSKAGTMNSSMVQWDESSPVVSQSEVTWTLNKLNAAREEAAIWKQKFQDECRRNY